MYDYGVRIARSFGACGVARRSSGKLELREVELREAQLREVELREVQVAEVERGEARWEASHAPRASTTSEEYPP